MSPYVLTIMNITPIKEIEIETMGDMGILHIIDDGVYVYICKVYSFVFKEYKPHAFVYGSHFSIRE